MLKSILIILLLLSLTLSLRITKTKFLYSTSRSSSNSNNNNDEEKKINDWFTSELKEGTTHIKYNKYAPTSEEAKNMTSVEFRKVIFDRMLEAEKDRRSQGVVGNANSDAYLNALEGNPPAGGGAKKSFNPFQKK